MRKLIGNSWDIVLDKEFRSEYFKNIVYFLVEEYKKYDIYPQKENIFKALQLTDYENVKVVIIGQDPYHGPNQAHGLCFSVPEGVKLPPSLQNIYKELANDLGITIPKSGDLTKWAKQGVLLLNSVLTVRRGTPKSHQNIGWEKFTDSIIEALNRKHTPIVYLLWGNDAKSKGRLISSKDYILQAAHPSPLSAYNGFFGCKHFSKTNTILRKLNLKEIDRKI